MEEMKAKSVCETERERTYCISLRGGISYQTGSTACLQGDAGHLFTEVICKNA